MWIRKWYIERKLLVSRGSHKGLRPDWAVESMDMKDVGGTLIVYEIKGSVYNCDSYML